MYHRKQINLTTPIAEFRYRLFIGTFENIKDAKIQTLGDLVSMSVSDIVNNSLIRQQAKLDIVKFVHSLGYKFSDEAVYILTNGTKKLVTQDTTLAELSFLMSTRMCNCFKYAGINTLGELVSKSQEELLTIQDFGDGSLRDTIYFLHLFGYKLEEKSIDKENTKNKKPNTDALETKKEKLVSQYTGLVMRNQYLLKREQELDEQIKGALETLKSLGVKDGQKIK